MSDGRNAGQSIHPERSGDPECEDETVQNGSYLPSVFQTNSPRINGFPKKRVEVSAELLVSESKQDAEDSQTIPRISHSVSPPLNKKFPGIEKSNGKRERTKSLSSLTYKPKIESESVPYFLFMEVVKRNEKLSSEAQGQQDQIELLKTNLLQEKQEHNLLKRKYEHSDKELTKIRLEAKELKQKVEYQANLRRYNLREFQDELQQERTRLHQLAEENQRLAARIDELEAVTDNQRLLETLLQHKLAEVQKNWTCTKQELVKSRQNTAKLTDQYKQTHEALNTKLRNGLRELEEVKQRLHESIEFANKAASMHQEITQPDQLAPTGKVALVFSDVANSTPLWEEFPQSMSESLLIHNSKLRSLLGKYSGYEVKTEGDSFMIAFSKTFKAILFCCEAQEVLTTSEWPDEILASEFCKEEYGEGGELLYRGLRVRMGIHAGIPICQVDPVTRRMDYFGQMVNKSARVSHVAQPGQILVSATSWNEALKGKAKDKILNSVVAVNLGKKKLRGINAEEELIQILPKIYKGRKFLESTDGPENKLSNLIVTNQMQKLISDNELLKKQVAELEKTLTKVGSEADTFGEKLFNLKVTGAVENPHETLHLIAEEFQEMKRKQDEMLEIFSGINNQEQNINNRVEELSIKLNNWVSNEEVEDARVDNADVHSLKRTLKSTKEALAKKVQEKYTYVKELKDSQLKITMLEQKQEAALNKKQIQITALESRNKLQEKQIEQLQLQIQEHENWKMSHESVFLQQELDKAKQQIDTLKRLIIGQELSQEQHMSLDELQIKGAKLKG